MGIVNKKFVKIRLKFEIHISQRENLKNLVLKERCLHQQQNRKPKKKK